jgi:hypothetical protein
MFETDEKYIFFCRKQVSFKAKPRPNNIKNYVRTVKKTQYFTVKKINLLTLFKEIRNHC